MSRFASLRHAALFASCLAATLCFAIALCVAPSAGRAQSPDLTVSTDVGLAATLSGTVVDAPTGRPLADVRVRTIGAEAALVRETATDAAGTFHLARLPAEQGRLVASRLGYQPDTVAYDLASAATITIRLTPRAFPLPGIEVTTTRATERGSPVAFTELSRGEIRDRYWAQD
ncbi:MAG TPA: carboxypeptidase regulatory-like domain-containing protein, partial [Candidatus Eisenbacteria bacterium]